MVLDWDWNQDIPYSKQALLPIGYQGGSKLSEDCEKGPISFFIQ